MKQLLLAALFCVFAFATKAQTSLDFHNNSPCTVYYQLFGDNGCGSTCSTGVIAMPPGIHWNMLTPSSFSWTPFTPLQFNYAVVYEGPVACAAPAHNIGNPGCMPVPSHLDIPALDATCATCAMMRPIDWNVHSASNGLLIFNP